MTGKNKYILNVALALPVKKTFSYLIPDHLESKAKVGCRVKIPFSHQKKTGYILEKFPCNDCREDLKEILDVLDPEPLFHDHLIPFFRWMADYYLFPIGRLIESVLPGGLNADLFRTARLTEKGLFALQQFKDSSEEKKILTWIKDHPGKRLPYSTYTLYPFQKRGWIITEQKSRKRYSGPLMQKCIRIKEGVDLHQFLIEKSDSFKAKDESIFFECLLQKGAMPQREISSRFSNGIYLVQKWIRAGVIERYDAPVVRHPEGKILVTTPIPDRLYDHQEKALHKIKELLSRQAFSACLVHGVTGSGKTEVYYEAVQYAIKLGKQAILIVPEIALAIYIEGLFRSRLGSKVTVFHSALSPGERYDQWMRMVAGDVDLVIGARSALFAPLPRLGLIIVDEEYDSSYKQDENPRYQARDAAIMRGKFEKCLVLLGAGTPSIQSYYHAQSGRYHFISMPDRIENRALPEITVVDTKSLCRTPTDDGLLSPILKEAIQKNLLDQKQTILFLNRRGFSPVYLCRNCGESVKCRNCDITLTYHLKENRLACHYCDFHSQPPTRCPICGKKGMRAYGFGTEKLEQMLSQEFPDARIHRMDRDSTRRKGQVYSILKRFNDHQIDILVGTQMLTKGYDFPDVTLVGVISADLSLGFPDFRAGERTFQLLSQVAGRAGRGDQKGRVIIQTLNPAHYAVVAAKNHDYQYFYEKELSLRKQLGYPPFTYLAHLRFQGNLKKATLSMAKQIGFKMGLILAQWPKQGRNLQILGPAEAPLAKLKGKYRCQILVKSKGAELLHYYLREVEKISQKILRKSGVNLVIDVDPYQML
ncbi:MAG: primosomal protein N' [Deltaproteobacteria bacterium]|nr:primosomal protein N' [Deltaproteobacteria bacterium]